MTGGYGGERRGNNEEEEEKWAGGCEVRALQKVSLQQVIERVMTAAS